MKLLRITTWLICVFPAALTVFGQTAPAAKEQPSKSIVVSVPAGNPLAETARLRHDLAARVTLGSEDCDTAIKELRSQASPTGLKIDADGDFAFAAIDVGRRLMSLGHPAEATQFFREADKALTAAIARTPNAQATEKTQFLTARATIRSRHLKSAAAAQADLDTALQLQPSNAYLKQQRAQLGSENPELVAETTKSTEGTP